MNKTVLRDLFKVYILCIAQHFLCPAKHTAERVNARDMSVLPATEMINPKHGQKEFEASLEDLENSDVTFQALKLCLWNPSVKFP